jgi:hypothetical protein
VLRPLKSSYIMVYGAAVIAMIVFMPQGLMGLFAATRARFEHRPPPADVAPAGITGEAGAEPA